jgi:translation initiation factor 5A
MADSKDQGSKVTPTSAGALKKGSYVLLKGWPCKVTDIKTSKTGKHGHAKCNITGKCILNGKSYNEVQPSHAHMSEPLVTISEYQVLYIDEDEGTISCLDQNDEEYTLSLLPEEEIYQTLLKTYEENEDGDNDVVINVYTAAKAKGSEYELVEFLKEVRTQSG